MESTTKGHLPWTGKGETEADKTERRLPRGILLELKLQDQVESSQKDWGEEAKKNSMHTF